MAYTGMICGQTEHIFKNVLSVALEQSSICAVL